MIINFHKILLHPNITDWKTTVIKIIRRGQHVQYSSHQCKKLTMEQSYNRKHGKLYIGKESAVIGIISDWNQL